MLLLLQKHTKALKINKLSCNKRVLICNKMERESKIEAYFRGKVGQFNGKLLKFVSPGSAGVPDRILIAPGLVMFIEFKRTGGKLSRLQEYWISTLRGLGQLCEVVSSKEEANVLLDKIIRRYESF